MPQRDSAITGTAAKTKKARSVMSAVTTLSNNRLLLLAGALWWAGHYLLLWNPSVTQAYANGTGYDLRFLLSVAGTVLALPFMAWHARRHPSFQFARWSPSYLVFAATTVCALAMITAPFVSGVDLRLGLAGAMLSGVGNSFALLFYGELHARIGCRFEPLAFAIEMIVGNVVCQLLSHLPITAWMSMASLLARASAILFHRYSRHQASPKGDGTDESPVRVDMHMGQLLILSALTGLTYGLMRLAAEHDTSVVLPLGFDPEGLGSLLGALLLLAVFALQRRISLFEECLLFSVPLVATGMLLASLQGASAVLAGVVNTCGFVCFFSLIWYFAAIMALHDPKRSLSFCTALFFFTSQVCQLTGAFVPAGLSGSLFTVVMYLLLAIALFMLWRTRLDAPRTLDECGKRDHSQPDGTGFHPEWAQTYGFSSREMEIVSLLLERTPYKQISTLLSVSENTVKTHVKSIYKKADVSSREELLDKLGSKLPHGDTEFPPPPDHRE